MKNFFAVSYVVVALYALCVSLLTIPVGNERKLPSVICSASCMTAFLLSCLSGLSPDLGCAVEMLLLFLYLCVRIHHRYRISFHVSNKPSKCSRMAHEARMFYSAICLLEGFIFVLLERRVPSRWLIYGVLLLLAILTFRAVSGYNLFLKVRPSRGQAVDLADESDLRAGALKSLFGRVEKYMDEKKPYANGALPQKYLARLIGVNRTDLSRAISWYAAKNYSQYINDYRVSYAMELMRRDPYMKVTEAGRLSGFSSEGAFTTVFKDRVGQTPSEFMRHERYRRNQP